MIIHTLCIDQERGKYLAYDAADPSVRAESWYSTEEAVGILVQRAGIVTVRPVDE